MGYVDRFGWPKRYRCHHRAGPRGPLTLHAWPGFLFRKPQKEGNSIIAAPLVVFVHRQIQSPSGPRSVFSPPATLLVTSVTSGPFWRRQSGVAAFCSRKLATREDSAKPHRGAERKKCLMPNARRSGGPPPAI